MDKNVAGNTGKRAGGGRAASGQEAGTGSGPLDVVPDAAVLIDEDGAVVACNEHARRLFGYDPTAAALAGLLDQAELPVDSDQPVRLRAASRPPSG